MKITLTVTGGFTGVGGKWEIDIPAAQAQRGTNPGDLESFAQLVGDARAAGVFGHDYSAAAQPGDASVPARLPARIPADLQTYQLQVDGESVRWSEPAAENPAGVPQLVRQLKQRIQRYAPRQPYPSR